MSTRIEQRNQRRKEVVEAIVIRQEPVHLVARIFHIPQRTIFDWLSLYRSGGWDALKEKRRSGRPRKASADDMRWIYYVVTLGNPQQYQFDFCLWTLNTLRALIERELGIKLSKSSVSRLLGHLGLSPQRPIYKSYRQDPRKVEEYLSKTFPKAVQRAREVGADIYFLDESAVRSDAHRGTTWGEIGETPVVRNSGGRFGLNVVSAISTRGDMRFAIFEGGMDSARFIGFLKKLRKDAGKPILVVADNAKYHHSKAGSVTFCVGKGSGPFGSPGTPVWPHRGDGSVARCWTQADSVWTKRGCRSRPWGQAGDNSLEFPGVTVKDTCAGDAATPGP
jgi:transposase